MSKNHGAKIKSEGVGEYQKLCDDNESRSKEKLTRIFYMGAKKFPHKSGIGTGCEIPKVDGNYLKKLERLMLKKVQSEKLVSVMKQQ